LGHRRAGHRQLQDRHRHAQHSGQEGDQDQPEGPTPAPQHADGQQSDEGGQHDQDGGLCHPGAIRQPKGRIVDLRGRHQDHQQVAAIVRSTAGLRADPGDLLAEQAPGLRVVPEMPTSGDAA
jgi:hypothetical protein